VWYWLYCVTNAVVAWYDSAGSQYGVNQHLFPLELHS